MHTLLIRPHALCIRHTLVYATHLVILALMPDLRRKLGFEPSKVVRIHEHFSDFFIPYSYALSHAVVWLHLLLGILSFIRLNRDYWVRNIENKQANKTKPTFAKMNVPARFCCLSVRSTQGPYKVIHSPQAENETVRSKQVESVTLLYQFTLL